MVAPCARASQLRRWVLRAGALPRDRGWSMVALVRLVLRYRRVHVYTVVEVGNLNSSTNFPVQFSSVSSWSPHAHSTAVSKDGSAPLGQHKY